MFVHFCQTLTKAEKIHFCGSEWNFYYRLYLLLKYSKPADTILEYLKKRLNDCEKSDRPDEKSKHLQERLVPQGIERIYIFGAGQMGRELLETLRSYGIEASGWIDNAKEKHKTVIEGLPCMGPEQIKDQEKCLFIVAMLDPSEVVEQLKRLSVSHFAVMGDIKKSSFCIAPLYAVL